MSENAVPANSKAVSKLHAVLLLRIRNEASSKGDEKLSTQFAQLSDEKLAHKIFANFRTDESSRGLRLTKFGLEVMKKYFWFFAIPLPDGTAVKPKTLLYLDRRATMPYYISSDGYVVFERDLAYKLKLAEGNMDVVREIEG
jgi:hypothetical protein